MAGNCSINQEELRTRAFGRGQFHHFEYGRVPRRRASSGHPGALRSLPSGEYEKTAGNPQSPAALNRLTPRQSQSTLAEEHHHLAHLFGGHVHVEARVVEFDDVLEALRLAIVVEGVARPEASQFRHL